MISLKELKVKYNHNDSFAPKSQDEKRFRDKHKVEVTADRNGNKDDVFKATNVKTFDREKEHGYNIGKDVEVYEEHDMPFDKPYKTKSATVTDKSGAKHGPESRVKNLARQTLLKLAPKPKGEPIVTVAPAKGDKVAEEVEEVDEVLKPLVKSVKRGLTLWGGSKHLKDIQHHVKNAPDDQLIRLSKGKNERPDPHTPRDLQTKLINRELKRRYGVKPGLKNEETELDEVLKPSMGAAAYIKDFVHSDDPKFKGKSKKQRMKQALAAYYSAKRGD